MSRIQTRDGIDSPVSESATGRYVYGIAAGAAAFELGAIGIEGSPVYTLPFQDICAIVHDCPTQPYSSPQNELLKRWVETHERVLETARGILGTVVPMRFDVIISPDNGAAADAIREWLSKDYDRLKSVMKRISGMSEYAVQVSYEPAVIGRHVAGEIADKRPSSPGIAYIQRQQLEMVVKTQMEALTGKLAGDFRRRLERQCGEVVVEKPREPREGRVMLLNLSCLVSPAQVSALGEELEKISHIEGFYVHFSGPWLPYSFVGEAPVPGA